MNESETAMTVRNRRYIPGYQDIPAERPKMPDLPVEKRASNFDGVELGFDRDQAIAAASRCLSCRQCLGCGLCVAVCHMKAIDLAQADDEIVLEADSVVIAPGVERNHSAIEEKFGYGKYLNVLTFLEFERILSDSGPYQGLVLRPSDGEIPKRIAFVLCDACQDDNAVSCVARAALAAKEKIPGLEVRLFSPAAAELLAHEVGANPGPGTFANTVSADISALSEDSETGNLVVEFVENGQTRREEVDLVVLYTTLQVPAEIRRLTRKLGVNLPDDRFEETGDISQVKTSKEGLFLAGFMFSKS